jgi:hypothetical protein
MKLLIFIIVGIIAGVALLAGVITLIGSQLPKGHVASRSAFLHQSPQNVYAVVRDFGSAPTWRPDLKRIEVEPQRSGPLRFREDVPRPGCHLLLSKPGAQRLFQPMSNSSPASHFLLTS